MAFNLELKIKINSLEKFQQLLKVNRIEQVKILNQKDIYYRNSFGLLKLRIENGNSEFIKYYRNESGDKRWSDYSILKIRGTDSEDFFNGILHIEAIVEKTRTLYLYKNTRIHLDSVKELGNFLELESVVKESKKAAEQEIISGLND